MTIEQLVGSIKGYFYKKWNVSVFEETVPKEIPIPCMFFPSPQIVSNFDTKMSYSNTYLMNVKIFHQTTRQAILKAEEIAQSIREQKYTIPILNEDGTETNQEIFFDRVETFEVDDNVAQIGLTWIHKYDFK